MTDVVFNSNQSVALLPSVQAVVRGLPAIKGVPSGPGDLGARPTEPVVRRQDSPGDELITFWGENNDYPQMMAALAEKSTIIPQALSDKAAMWIAGGVIATNGRDSDEEIDDDDIYEFLNSVNTQQYLLEAATDMAWWWNAFPEFILSRDRKKINEINSNETAFCRFGRQNPSTGLIDRVYLNANWPQARATDPETTVLPCISPYMSNLVDYVRNGRKEFKFIYPLNLPTPGKAFYQTPAWDATRKSGWLDYLFAIPQFKKFGMQNKMSLRYQVEVPQDYWERVYGERWEKASTEERMQIRSEFLNSITERLTNVENANKAILTDTWYDTQTQQMLGVKINVLDDKEKHDAYNEDYSDGQANLLYALGTDPSLFGFQSKDIQRSGGSDKVQSFNIFLAKSQPTRSRILLPFKFAAEYNGWTKRYRRITFKFRDIELTTLDTGAPTKQTNQSA